MKEGVNSVETRMGSIPFWFYFIAFTAAELLITLLDPVMGLVCHGIVLTVILVSSAFIKDSHYRNFTVALSLVPLVRIISVSMPLAAIPQIYWYVLIYIPLIIAAIVVMWIVGLKARSVGLVFTAVPAQVLFGIASGLSIGILEYAVVRPNPLVDGFSFEKIWLPAVIMVFTTGFGEEFIFRGVLQQTAEPVMGRMGMVYISAVFAILHIGHLSVFDVFLVFAIALYFAFLVKTTGSLIGVTLAHGLTNVFLYFIGPFMLP